MMRGRVVSRRARMPEVEMKHLMKSLGESINEALNESPKINQSIDEIREAGYDVFLVIEAKIGFNRKGKGEGETITVPARATDDPVRLRITSEDAKFLKSLKIATDEY
jgi:hypothetical protein